MVWYCLKHHRSMERSRKDCPFFLMNQSETVTEQIVLKALQGVQDPDLERDVVSLGFVKDLRICSGAVAFRLELKTPAQQVQDLIQARAREVVAALPGVTEVQVEMGFRVSAKPGGESNRLIPDVRNAIAVASGKGGVGKSTIAANLATALQLLGTKVGLMDADVYGPSIPMLMGATEAPQIVEGDRIIPPVQRGIKLISMGYFLPKDDAVIWRGPMLHKMIQDFLGVVQWGDLDYLIIDLPPGTGDIQLSLCQTIPLTGAVIVSTPQDLALQVASKAIAMFRKLQTPILGIVENLSYYVCSHCGERDDIFGHGGAKAASAKLDLPFLGQIPLSSVIRDRSDRGQPVALDTEEPGHSQAFRDIADAVASQANIAHHRELPGISIET